MDNTRQQLSELMKKLNKSQKQVSKETNLSTSLISQFLDGTYKGDNEKVKTILDKYIELTKNRLSTTNTINFYENLYNTEQTLFICNYAHINNEITLVSGNAGTGKTTALNYYKDNNIGVVMVTADPCSSSPIGILSSILEALNRPIRGNKNFMMRELLSYFKDTNKLLIIDEADHLTFSALQTIRTLNDKANIGIVLAGNDKLYRQMLTGSKCYELEQLKTRIVVRRRVENLYTVEEIKNIFNCDDKDIIASLIKIAQDESLRTAIKIYKATLETNKKLSVTDINDTIREFLCK